MREERLTHLASIGGQLAGSSDTSTVDEAKWMLTTGREQWRAGWGYLAGFGTRRKELLGIQYRWLAKAGYGVFHRALAVLFYLLFVFLLASGSPHHFCLRSPHLVLVPTHTL